ncbi:DUF2087 domain-containing protein [Geosporobacter ferrireducens]|uniref:DUF2087 domain-containing protein n=1 Tax=Geosporobacter ferrireducens TaxID=1424294 RepID=A0A1D8GFG9_9FIRM|nr:DUF2087 domain-containing protein [Geosporobacter ferrireducens]AOT69654.1 hypothetical protein Gferi_08725 [Geosporobacter ferrireducens]MTI54641.1 DUF2087 domain-containing protein [Geosporobacter ferrireducens]
MSKRKRKINISIFLDDTGKIVQIPVPNRTKIPVLSYLTSKFENDRIYSEKEINEIIDRWHTFGDYFILRRLLIDHRFLERTPNGANYWVVKKVDEKEGDRKWTEGNN